MRKNKFITSIIIAGALVATIGVASHAEAGKIKGSSIRLRKEANTESTVIDTYGDGEVVDIIEKDGEWYKVKINGTTGYIYQDYIEVTEDEKQTSEANENKEENSSKKDNEEKKEENNKADNKKEENTGKSEEQPKTEETNKQSSVKLGKVKAVSTQKIYILPNLGSSKIGEVKKNGEINIIQVLNGWAYISTGELSGWTRYEKIVAEDEKDNDKVTTYEQKDENADDNKQEEAKKDNKKAEENNLSDEQNSEKQEDNKKTETNNSTTEKKAYINVASVNFRKESNTSSEIIDVLELNAEITITGEDEEWYKVKYGNEEGYVAKQYISDSKTKETTSRAGERREVKQSSSNKVTGEDIVAYAKNYLGYPYVYAAESPSVGFDCSGLVWYVYKHFGYTVSRSSVALANDGKTISNKSDLKPGDILIFLAYNDYSRVGHVGIYIGNNEFIHANDEKTGVIITSLDYGKYPERFVSGRRIIN